MRFRLFLLAFALICGPGWGEAPAPRTFLVELGHPGLAVDVNGLESLTDDEGSLRLTMRLAVGDTLHFRSLDPGWALDVIRHVPVEDPAVPVLFDLTAELRQAPPPEPRPLAEPPDPCRNRQSLLCRKLRWDRYEEAVAGRDCAAALDALADLSEDYPELLSAADTLTAFAGTYLDCGLRRGDLELVGRAVELARGYGESELWCDGAGSRVLARALEALDQLEAAAEGARLARDRCRSTVPLEWEFYFLFRMGRAEALDPLIAAAPRRLGLFLTAWREGSRGECATRVELEPTGDLPCRGLPQAFCSEQYGRILLRCGAGREDFKASARYLRAALPLDPAAWTTHTSAGRKRLFDLAEAEMLSGDPAAAAPLYRRLLREENAERASDEPAASPSSEGQALSEVTFLRRYGDALLLSRGGERIDRESLLVYQRVRSRLAPETVARAIVSNNIAVLHGRLFETMDSNETARELRLLEASLRHVPEEESRLRLWLQHNLLSLKIQLVERAPDLDAPAKLSGLEELRLPFAEYQRELASVSTLPGASLETFVYEGRRFTIAVP